MINIPREEGMEAFRTGTRFDQCPNQGFRESDIEWRWEWQKGWLRAQQDQKDTYEKRQETR